LTEPHREIPEAALSRAVSGMNLMPGTLRDQLGDVPTLLVFLRHFGCIFCRQTVSDLRDTAESNDAFPPVLFFFQGRAMEGRLFLRRYWPEARAIADPDLAFYEEFGIGRATWVQAFGPAVLRANRRARQRGFENGERQGDIWRMPGAFLVRGARILWSHRPRHAGDPLQVAEVPLDAT